MDASDLAVISVVSVLSFGFVAIGATLFGIWVGMRNDVRELRAEMTDMRSELMTEIRAAGVRVSDVELEQARMQGVMSVIRPQAHDHARESAGTRQNPPADSHNAPPPDND